MDVFDALCGRDVIGRFDIFHDFQMVIIAMLFMPSIHFMGFLALMVFTFIGVVWGACLFNS